MSLFCECIKFEIQSDFVGAPNTGLGLTRYYNSGDTTSSAFGANWHSTWHRGITISGNTVTVTRADGRQDIFTNTSGIYTADPDVTSVLTATTSNGVVTGYQLVTEDDATEAYSASGVLLSVASRAGLITTFAYNASNQLATVTGPFGHVLSFAYNGNGQVASMTVPDGGVYSYAYDANNNQISVTYPDTTARQYLYENASFPNALTGLIDENNNRYATWGYDMQGRAISSQHSGGAELTTVAYNTNASTVTDANGNAWTYNLQTIYGAPRPVGLAGAPLPALGGNAFTYDSNGFLASKTDYNGNLTTYAHDTRGEQLSRTEAYNTPIARTTSTTWASQFHLPVQITEPNGLVKTYSYDVQGNMLSRTESAGGHTRTWTYTYNAAGQVLTATDPLGHAKSFAYDAQGNMASITDALAHTTQIKTHDADGRPTLVVDPNGLATTLGYNARGLLTSRNVGGEITGFGFDPAGNLTSIANPDGSKLTLGYDPAHRLTGITDSLGNHVVYTLDASSNRTNIAVYDPFNNLSRTASFAYDSVNRVIALTGAQGQTTTYGYDNNGNRISVTDPLNQVTSNSFDALNRLVKLTDPNSGVTTPSYDANDRLTSLKDPRTLTTSYAYDGLDDLTSLQSPDTGGTTKTYDSAGNVVTSTDARGKTTTYSYDAMNRRVSAAFADGKTIAWQYDQGTNGIGHLTKMTDVNGSTSWSYDIHGRVNQKQQQTGALTLTTSYAYNASGQLTTTTYPSGRLLTYAYDTTGHVNSISVDGTALVSSIIYRPFGPAVGWSQGQGGKLAYSRTFDQDGRISGITINGTSSNETISLAYDAASRITGILDSAATVPAINADTVSYTYDSASNRLTGNTGSTPHSYTYDAVGNITSDGANTFTYDARGRMAQSTVGGVTTQYAINGLSQRIQKSGSGVSTGALNFVYDERGRLIGEYDATGNVVQETVWLNDLPVGVLKPGKQYYVNPDHLGAPISIVDSTGTTVWRWDRNPFGNGSPNQSPSGGTAFVYNLRLPGQYYDSESELFYNFNRDYNPALGRYVQSDPIGLAGGINSYRYVQNNPVTWIDSKGLNLVLDTGFSLSPLAPYYGSIQLGINIGHTLMGIVLGLFSNSNELPFDESGDWGNLAFSLVRLGKFAFEPHDHEFRGWAKERGTMMCMAPNSVPQNELISRPIEPADFPGGQTMLNSENKYWMQFITNP